MSSANNPIIRQFHAAAKLVNEWRDTILYTGLLIWGANDIMGNGLQHWQYFGTPFLLGWLREWGRAFTWNKSSNQTQLTGYKTTPVSNRNCKPAALAGNMSALFAYNVMFNVVHNEHDAGSLLLSVITLSLATYYNFRAGGIKSVFKAYTDVMWDWPRKKNDGGTTQTQKLKNGFNDMAGRLGKLAPKPALKGNRRTALQHLQK